MHAPENLAVADEGVPEDYDESYREFQSKILKQRYNVYMIIQDHSGSVGILKISDTYKYGFGKDLFGKAASIQLINSFRGKLDLDLPILKIVTSPYDGDGPFEFVIRGLDNPLAGNFCS
jgi:hypothetical protein